VKLIVDIALKSVWYSSYTGDIGLCPNWNVLKRPTGIYYGNTTGTGETIQYGNSSYPTSSVLVTIYP